MIETTSLDHATPSFLSRYAILHTYSQQVSDPYKKMSTCELLMPEIPFNRANQILGDSFLHSYKDMYVEIAPLIVRRVYCAKNILCHLPTPGRTPDSN